MRTCVKCHSKLGLFEFVLCKTCAIADKIKDLQSIAKTEKEMITFSINNGDFDLADEWRAELEKTQTKLEGLLAL